MKSKIQLIIAITLLSLGSYTIAAIGGGATGSYVGKITVSNGNNGGVLIGEYGNIVITATIHVSGSTMSQCTTNLNNAANSYSNVVGIYYCKRVAGSVGSKR